ncbi:glycosyltransferase [Aeromonas veronii]
MKVAHISTYDYGGAGSAALLLDQYCKEHGLDSTLYVKRGGAPSSVRIASQENKISDFMRRCLVKLTKQFVDQNYLFYGIFDRLSEFPDRTWREILSDKDVIFVYWISTFTTLTQLARVLSTLPAKKIYVVNFDMANMTGGCHYSFGCSQFSIGCQNCPGVYLSFFKSFVRQANMEKTVAVAKLNAKSLSFTPFVQTQAASAAVKFTDNFLFSLPVSNSTFRPTVTSHNRTIFIGAYSPQDKRKGFDLLCRILLALSSRQTNSEMHQPITLLFPSGTELPDYIKSSFSIEFYPYANNSADLNSTYNRASLFLNTTLDDSGPVMVLQAMLAGLPVISHRIGYAADIIRHGENGYFVDYLNVNAFVDSVLDVLGKWDVNEEKRKKIHADASAFSSSLPPFSEYLIDLT